MDGDEPTGGVMNDVSKESAETAVDEVRRLILQRIHSGVLQPGQRLGSERDLALELGVSRSTLRHALSALEQAGVVRRVPGRGGGTFVSHPKIERDLSSVAGLPAYLRRQGFTAGTRVISAAMAAADEATVASLDLKPGALVLDIVRVRLADGVPISLEEVRLPAERFPGLLELPLGGSLYELLEEHYSVTPAEVTERIEVVLAGPDEAAVLDIAPGSALLSITRTARTADGEPFEFSHDLFRADRTSILVRTQGKASASESARRNGHALELQRDAGP